jgi:hypothetical protein
MKQIIKIQESNIKKWLYLIFKFLDCRVILPLKDKRPTMTKRGNILILSFPHRPKVLNEVNVRESRLIGLSVPAVSDKVFGEDQSLARGQDDGIIKPRDRLAAPPFVIDAPAVFYGDNFLPPFEFNKRRQPVRTFLDRQRLRQVYRLSGISA